MAASPPIRQLGVPITSARRRSTISILAGPDVTDIAGLDSGIADSIAVSLATTGTAGSSANTLSTNRLPLIGSIQQLDVTQTRGIKTRYGFNYDPYQAYQAIPTQSKITLKAEYVRLNRVPYAEATFNFLPSSLIFQQYPFIIQINDLGIPSDPATFVTRIFYGCWFSSDTITYGVSESQKEDQRLISSVDITCTRMVVLDNSQGGDPGGVLAKAVIGGITTAPTVQNAIQDFPL